jgi:hypothetical protein
MTNAREERIKLRANFLNTLAIAFFGLGGLAAVISGHLGAATTARFIATALFIVGCCVASYALHSAADRTLKELDQ